MLAPRHAAKLRRDRVIAWVVLAIIVALLGVAGFVVVRWPPTWLGALMLSLGLIPPAIGAVVRMRVEALVVVFDRLVQRTDELPLDERRRLRMRLTESVAELDGQLVALGVKPLDSYLELRLAPGIARHDPALARADIERLLGSSEATLDADTRRALEQLAEQLAVAAEQGARFCLLPTSSWSGAIETNLRLYYGG